MGIIKQAAPEGQDCNNCRFSQSWEAPKPSPRIITECRRFPPALTPYEDWSDWSTDYPSTVSDGWCGEWRAVE